MNIELEYDEDIQWNFDFDPEEITVIVAEKVLETQGCPFDCNINVLITDNARICEINRSYRQIDRPTDVLSFPGVDFDTPGVFDIPKEREADYFDPDSGLLVLGDIILSVDKIREQAESYGHSTKREFAFLVAHSMLHLCGYDHMESEEARVMEEKQEAVLQELGITREA